MTMNKIISFDPLAATNVRCK